MSKNIQTSLKIGIVGCGNMAKIHARLLKKYANTENLAVCDKDDLRLEDFAFSTGITHTYNDLGAMLEKFQPDIVHIVTPPATHKAIALQCLENNSHILIEKPMCVSLKEAKEIAEAAKRKKRLVCVDHMRSFDPLIIKTHKILESKKCGEIINISVGYSYDYLKRVNTDAAARWINNLPGGSFFDLMPHLLCILNDFLPDIKLEKSLCLRDNKNILTDLHCLFTSSKGSGALHMSLHVFPLKNYVEFECTNGILRVDFRNFLLIWRKNYGLPNAVERIVENLSIGWQMILGSFASIINFVRGRLDPYAGLDHIIQRFFIAVLQGGDSPVSVEKAHKLLALTQKIFANEKISDNKKERIPQKLGDADVLVTGGTGFIGRRLVNRLLEKGHKVRVFSHRELSLSEQSSLFSGNVEFFFGNIYASDDIETACQGIQTIYHLAAAMQGDWNYHMDTTITGTRNILNAADKAGVKRFIYASTLNVYDAKNYPQDGVINETFAFEDQPEKRGAYSHAKLKAEKIVRDFVNQTQMSISLLRPGLVYGPGIGKGPLLGDVGRRIGKNCVMVMGMGSRKLPLTYVDNLIDAFLLFGESNEKVNGKIYNIVDHDYPTQCEFIKIYRELTKEK
ncbi:hypothetical protein MNBD_UNCLBAC01-1106, partial [hydrothermal vent metagenome]